MKTSFISLLCMFLGTISFAQDFNVARAQQLQPKNKFRVMNLDLTTGFALIVIILMFSCSDKQKKHFSYYPNGNIEAEIDLDENGEFHGLGIEYYPNGELKAKTEMNHGKTHGRSIVYWPNGNVLSEETFIDGKRNGESIEYNKEGKIVNRTFFSFGRRQGLVKEYYDSGTLKSHFEYDSNKLYGIQKMFHKNGSLGTIGEARNDLKEGIWYFFDQFGDTLSIILYEKDSIVREEFYKESIVIDDNQSD